MTSLCVGIVGLPNVGKSTLFNALTSSNQAQAANYPFCTIEPNEGIVQVPDARIPVLAKISHTNRLIYAPLKILDIAGLVAGASQGEGLGNKFLVHIRETDAIIHVVRCFDSSDVIHVSGSVDPIRDIEIINLELALSDLQMIDQAVIRVEKQAKTKKELQLTLDVLKKVQAHLNQSLPVRLLSLTDEEREAIQPYPLLTSKKVLYVANVAESDLPGMSNPYVEKVKAYAEKEGNKVITVCAQLEQEIAQLPAEDRPEFLETLGLKESGLDRMIKASFDMLGLITFLTTGEIETRAWTIPKNCRAQDAAGKIHTDISKGFIRAEVVNYVDFVACNGRNGAREKGLVRFEGKDYIVQDGDIILFMHN